MKWKSQSENLHHNIEFLIERRDTLVVKEANKRIEGWIAKLGEKDYCLKSQGP